MIVIAFEGQISVEHSIEDDSCCPYIYPTVYFVMFIIDETLRSHIPQATSIQIFMFH